MNDWLHEAPQQAIITCEEIFGEEVSSNLLKVGPGSHCSTALATCEGLVRDR